MRALFTGKRVAAAVALSVLAAGLVVLAWAWRSQPKADYSNIRPADYVGPQRCGECHERNFGLWKDHAHRRMNLTAGEDAVTADFSDAELTYAGTRMRFERLGDRYTMAVLVQDRLVRRFEITRTVGSLYMQYFVGRQIEGPEPPEHPTYTLESKLPFAYCFALRRWVPEPYLDSTVDPEHDFQEGQLPEYVVQPPLHNWNISCMTCHNTYAYEARLWRQAPPNDVAGLWQGGYPKKAILAEGDLGHRGKLDLGKMRALDATELVTVGISCESCHFGGREHAENGEDIRFVPTSPGVTVRKADLSAPVASNRKDPYVVNSICSQCHNSQLDRYPNGASAVNSNEATDILASSCVPEVKCTDCHNPHRRGPGSGAADQPSHTSACIGCHEELGAPAAARAHTRHADAQVSCLDCHMPRIVAGLDTVTRTHKIGPVADQAMIAAGAPNSCNLCHLDRSIRWTADQLASGWGRKIELAEGSRDQYGGSFDRPVGEAWLHSSDKFTRLAAMEAYARSPLVKDPAPYLLQALEDPQSFNRTVTLITLNRLLGRQVSDAEYALVSPRTTRQKQLAALAASASLSAELARRDPATARASAHRSSLVAAERGARRDVRTRAAR